MASLIHRASGSLAVKALPALYGAGLILLVVRVIPLGDFGRYGMAIAFVNIVAALSRGLWTVPLVIRAARGETNQMLAPAMWYSLATALVGALIGIILLPLLDVGFELAVLAGIMLVILVPRDIAIALAQASQQVWTAFSIEAGYFIGSLTGFVILTMLPAFRTAEAVMGVNVAASLVSALIGIGFEPGLMRPGRHGDWSGTFHLGKWVGLLALGEIFLQQGDALLVGIFFSPQMIAPYIAGRTLLRMYGLFSQSVNFLVLPSASRMGASNQIPLLRSRLKLIIKVMEGILIPANVVMWFAAPYIFPLVLGGKYVASIPFFRVMIVATLLEPVYSVLTNVLAGIGKPQTVLPVLATALVFNIAANLSLLPLLGLWAAPIVLVLTYGVLAGGSVLLVKKHLIPDLVT
jgi:O-antigen/teichoic acid export membrane protein